LLLVIIVTLIVSLGADSGLLGIAFGAVTASLLHQQKRIAELSAKVRALEGGKLEESKVVTPEPVPPPPTAMRASAPTSRQEDNVTPPLPLREECCPEQREIPPVHQSSAHPTTSERSPAQQISPPLGTFPRLEDIVGPSIAKTILQANTIARVGVALLFFGVAFALKLAAQQGLFPIELRLILAVIGGGLLLTLGLRMRNSKRPFALILQGGGLGILYITAFVTFRIYGFVGAPTTSVVLIGITIVAALLATHQDAKSLALLALVGGFLAPLLTSTGRGDPRALLAYFAILDVGILFMCLHRGWGSINVLGFIFTVLAGGTPSAMEYRPEQLLSYQLFLVFFLILFTTNTYLLARKNALQNFVAAIMSFGPPFFGFIFQYKMLEHLRYGTALSCVGFGAFYYVGSRFLRARHPQEMRPLIQAYSGIGLSLLSLTIPFAVSNRVTSAIWAAEGVGLLWSGLRQRHRFTHLLGFVLLLVASPLFLSESPFSSADHALLTADLLGTLILVVSYIVAAKCTVDSQGQGDEKPKRGIAGLCGSIAAAWWIFGGLAAILRSIDAFDVEIYPASEPVWGSIRMVTCSIFLYSTAPILWSIGRRWKLPGFLAARRLPLILLYLSTWMLLMTYGSPASLGVHPLMRYGSITWIWGFIVHYAMLKRSEQDSPAISVTSHSLSLWLLTFLATWEAHWLVGVKIPSGSAWGLSTLSVVPAAMVLGVITASRSPRFWPFQPHRDLYMRSLYPVGMWLFACPLALDLLSSGNAVPLPYIPLLNPLDIAQGLAFFAVASLCRTQKIPAYRSLSLWLFVWTTSVLIRSIHHYADVAWDAAEIFHSIAVQTALSIFWSVLALGLMWTAHVKRWRDAWKSGAVLIAVVVVKLLLVDLSGHNSEGRIIAFLGVGLLMLGIGYVAPIPPESGKS